MPDWFLLGALLTVCSGTDSLSYEGGSEGEYDCRCLKEGDPGMPDFSEVTSDDCAGLVYTDHEGTKNCIPVAGYGLNTCEAYDTEVQPKCADADGNILSTPDVAWCKDLWCFVDPDTCEQDPRESFMFSQVQGLYYSYKTCGSDNEFAKWAKNADKSTSELADVVEDYLTDLRETVEKQYRRTANDEVTEDCEYTDQCNCRSCERCTNKVDDSLVTCPAWEDTNGTPLLVDFDDVSVYQRASARRIQDDARLGQCMGSTLKRSFLKVKKDEYTSTSRVAYIYYGHQDDGTFIQWPASKGCDEFDPRFRPWYVVGTTGPKDIVVIIDASGSMKLGGTPSRWNMATDAMSKLLRTVTSYDYMYLVLFDDDTWLPDSDKMLLKMTDENKEFLTEYVMDHSPMGGTNYDEAFNAAFDVFENSQANGQTSGCQSMILFMTDGLDRSGLPVAANIRSKQEDLGAEVVVFTYAFGADAVDAELPRQIACQNSGVAYSVQDGDDLGSTMSKYYEYFANGQKSETTRWIQYSDFLTGEQLMAGCQPVYDPSNSDVTVVGVVCIDLNIIISVKDLKKRPGFASFVSRLEDQSEQCTTFEYSPRDLVRIRDLAGTSCSACDMGDAAACVEATEPATEGSSLAHGAALLLLTHIFS